MSGDSDKWYGRGGIYIKICSRKKIPDWKLMNEALSREQGYTRFLKGQIAVESQEKPQTIWATVEAETNPVKQKQENIKYLNQKG